MNNKFTHQAPIIKIKKECVENSDNLSVVRLYDNTAQVVVKSSDWEDGELAVWVQPQSIVDTEIEVFSWLKKNDNERFVRVKPVKLRGVLSQGCFVKIPKELSHLSEGEDVSSFLSIKHWEPEEQYDKLTTGGDWDSPGYFKGLSKYDVDGGAKLHKLFDNNWECVVTSKIHGANCRIFYDKESSTFKVGTRNHWVKESPSSVHWLAFHSLSVDAKQFLVDNPNYLLYGEAYGDVKNFWYGATKKTIRFAAFDIMQPNRQFTCYDKFSELCSKYSIHRVPELYRGNHDYELFLSMKDRMAYWDNKQIEEGIVVKTVIERQIGKNFERAIYKLINKDYK